MNTHYSTFELDVAFAEGSLDEGPLAAHLRACDRCRAYVAALEGQLPLPDAPPARPKFARLVGVGTTVLLAAAAVLLFVRTRDAGPGYVGTKGTPAVQLLLRRDGATRIWDGRESVRAGDALALHVACEGYRHVTIAGREGAAWQRLEDVECPAQPSVLPFTLRVDDRPGDEAIAVVLSSDRLSSEAIAQYASGKPAAPHWVHVHVLAKEAK